MRKRFHNGCEDGAPSSFISVANLCHLPFTYSELYKTEIAVESSSVNKPEAEIGFQGIFPKLLVSVTAVTFCNLFCISKDS